MDWLMFFAAIGFVQNWPVDSWQFRWAAMTLKRFEQELII